MKLSGVVALAAVSAVAFGLQGCATTRAAAAGAAGSGSSWEATGSNTAIIQRRSANQPVVKADTKANFEAVVAAIHEQMKPGGRFQYVDKSERATVDEKFTDMRALFDKYGSVAKMGRPEQVSLFEDQGTINAILTKNDGDRVICKSEIVVGSHFPSQVCQTYAQIRALENQTQRQLMRDQQRALYQGTETKLHGFSKANPNVH